jgi:hypothetical protein
MTLLYGVEVHQKYKFHYTMSFLHSSVHIFFRGWIRKEMWQFILPGMKSVSKLSYLKNVDSIFSRLHLIQSINYNFQNFLKFWIFNVGFYMWYSHTNTQIIRRTSESGKLPHRRFEAKADFRFYTSFTVTIECTSKMLAARLKGRYKRDSSGYSRRMVVVRKSTR